MARNIELKIKIDGFTDILNILKQEKVELQQLLNQRDIYYIHPQGLLKLRIFEDKGELIFYQRDESTTDRISNYHILNVEPNQAEEFFARIFEIETEVVKTRKLFIYKNTRIHLDEVKNLGEFLELETVVRDNMQESKTEFDEVVELLKLDVSKQIKSTYRTLLMNK